MSQCMNCPPELNDVTFSGGSTVKSSQESVQ